jgi:hypothetical protein
MWDVKVPAFARSAATPTCRVIEPSVSPKSPKQTFWNAYAGEFPVACSHVADAIGSASAVEHIKRLREIRTVAVLYRCK